jgi:hypothetical protein
MLKRKSNWTCSYCSKIVKDPIELPCDDLICSEHLSDRDVRKENKIKCNDCQQVFQVKNKKFKSSNALKKLIEKQSYLSDEELNLKQDLELSIRKLFQFYDEFIQKKANLKSVVSNHFEGIRFKITEHREGTKKRIDEIALKMIDDSENYESMYLSNLDEDLFETPSFESLDNTLNEIEEKFRDPNLLIETIKEMQQKQEESIQYIQFKLNQMSKIKDDLMVTNDFQPNLYSFNQEDTFLFGSIKLNGNSNMNSFKSEILTGEQQSFELLKLCEFSPNDKWSLLYRATRDEFEPHVFHSKCDGHASTLTLIKAKESKFIFGGFTTVSWDSSSLFKSDANAFIFSLTNKDNTPLKMKINPKRHRYAMYCEYSRGPSFGGGCDIRIGVNAHPLRECYSQLSDTYSHPQYECGTDEAQTFLSGSMFFQMADIEVYQKE